MAATEAIEIQVFEIWAGGGGGRLLGDLNAKQQGV
jgi:hypothetical protein